MATILGASSASCRASSPNGDVWTLDFGDDKVVYMPKGDPSKATFYCQSTDGKPNKDSPCKLNGPIPLSD
jgi:hypothetical protein